VITTFAEDAFAGLCRMNGIDEVQGDPLNLPDGDGSSPRGTIQADPIMKVIGTVLSRPKLERAVLDVGHRSLAATCQTFRITRTAAGRELPDVTTEEIGPETMTLALGPASRDLIIGETVEIRPAEITLTAIRHRTLFGVRNGIAEWMRPL
jgi:D-serine deaminase-like pyridoxal phosphate-dependent protein